MEPGAGGDLQRQILQSTLQEVARRDQDEETPDCCVICLEAITEPCRVQPCGHTNFDYLCVSSWLFATPQCPLCKTSVSEVLHGPPDNIQTTRFDQDKSAPRPSWSSSARFSAADAFLGRRHAARRPRPQRNGYDGTAPPRDIVRQRREVYRRNLYSKHVGSNRMSRYRELTPQMFREDEDLVSRARMWIRRELQVFSFLTLDESDADAAFSQPETSAATLRRANNAEFLLEYIVAILKSVDTLGSGGQAEDMLSDFLGRDNTRLFLHELRAWLRSPFTKLEDWDRAVQYDDTSVSRPEVPRRDANGGARGSRSRRPHGGNDTTSDQNGRKGDFYRPGRDKPHPRYRGRRHEPYDTSHTSRSRRLSS
ncbi:hypothetical protein B0I35DRAFT_426475 [Stachybotrys elegans]|uniref:RING-type E3 ubiquitin transferase n=1 Tax=Stachybotrys elegans TaxID=80388 RepID=A0A8K0WTG4_9HYPO|nr:hypothetical protein B0I35DRAFT_426475 [Stachybotrys elegans]